MTNPRLMYRIDRYLSGPTLKPMSSFALLQECRLEIERLHDIAVDLHWMARRYADGRQSYATSLFNGHTRTLIAMGVDLNSTGDQTVWARDAGGRAYDGLTEAEAGQGDPPDWTHDGMQRENERLRTGIESIIRQCRESAVMGGRPEDLEAVADELEELLEGKSDD